MEVGKARSWTWNCSISIENVVILFVSVDVGTQRAWVGACTCVRLCYLGDVKMTTEDEGGGGGTMPQKVHYLLTCAESVYFTQVSLKLESCYV